MCFTLKMDLTADQVLACLLLETAEVPEITQELFTSRTQVRSVIQGHLYRFGMSKLSKPVPDALLLRSVDIKSALRGFHVI